ncbi:MAG: response regulator, partial [Planctomycetota bacterium]
MSRALSVFIYNPNLELPFHQPFEEVKNISNLGRAYNVSQLKDAIKHLDIDLIAVNLDGEDGLNIVKQITLTSPNRSIVGISSKINPRAIINAMRAGCGQFVSWPVDPIDLQEAIDQVRFAYMATMMKSKIICMVGASGGVGTTTIACNL